MGTDEDPWDFLDAAPKIPDPLPLTDTDTDDEVVSVQSAPAASSSQTQPLEGVSVGVGARAKVFTKGGRRPLVSQYKDDLPDICSPPEAIQMHPQDKKTVNETGVPSDLLVERESKTSLSGSSIYLCRHPVCQDKPFHAQSLAGLYSHVRRKHLGVVLACPYCVKKLYWNAKGWKSHMGSYHRGAPWYGTSLKQESQEALDLLEQIEADPLSASKASLKEERRYRKSIAPKQRAETGTEVLVQPSAALKECTKEGPVSDTDTLDSSSDSSSSEDVPADEGEVTANQPLTFSQLRGPPPPAEQLAIAPVAADIPLTADEDMPELEKTPPRLSAKRPRTEEH